VGPEAIIGRSAVATVRIADPRVSTVHAEVSWRAEGPTLLARGGRRHGGRAPRGGAGADRRAGRASATIVAAPLRAGGPVPWDALAGALWPDEAAIRARGATGAADDWTAVDERRWRNRFDQPLHALRRQLEPARGARTVTVRGGAVRLDVAPGDVQRALGDHR
jgi:hypothetical protein